MGKRILIKGWGGVARGDRRKVKMIIQDHNRAFLGSQQFRKYKPGTSESWSVLLRHCGFLNQFLLPGTALGGWRWGGRGCFDLAAPGLLREAQQLGGLSGCSDPLAGPGPKLTDSLCPRERLSLR